MATPTKDRVRAHRERHRRRLENQKYVSAWVFDVAQRKEPAIEHDNDLACSLAELAIVGATGDADSAKAPDRAPAEARARASAALRAMADNIDEALRILHAHDK